MSYRNDLMTAIRHRDDLDPDRCRKQCPAGSPCVLDMVPNHDWHICADRACACHKQSRYAGERARLAALGEQS